METAILLLSLLVQSQAPGLLREPVPAFQPQLISGVETATSLDEVPYERTISGALRARAGDEHFHTLAFRVDAEGNSITACLDDHEDLSFFLKEERPRKVDASDR